MLFRSHAWRREICMPKEKKSDFGHNPLIYMLHKKPQKLFSIYAMLALALPKAPPCLIGLTTYMYSTPCSKYHAWRREICLPKEKIDDFGRDTLIYMLHKKPQKLFSMRADEGSRIGHTVRPEATGSPGPCRWGLCP